MAKYSVELNDIIESGFKLFNFDYTFYDEDKKPELESRFVDYFRFREIGTETVGRFQHYLKVKFVETLPYYNMLLETSLYEYDLKNNYNLTETFSKTNNKNITGNASQYGLTSEDLTNTGTENIERNSNLESNTDRTDNNVTDKTSLNKGKNKDVESDTPTALLSMTDIENNVYATRAKIGNTEADGTEKQITTGTTNDKTTGTSSEETQASRENTTLSKGNFSNDTDTETNEAGTETYTLERVGDIGVDTTPDKLKKHIEVQKILTTIYKQFFNECEDLFMQIY